MQVQKIQSHSIQVSGSPTLARVSLKYSNTDVVGYSAILIIEIVSGEKTITKFKNQRREQKKNYSYPS